MQWQVKLSSHLGDGPHFLVLVSSAPTKSRIPQGPARLHVQERGFCLTTGVPPRISGQWLISNLRRYGVVEGRFCFEGGSRCGRGEGLHVLLTDQGEEITSTLKVAATGTLHNSRRRPVSRNMSVMDSPRRPPMRSDGRAVLDLSEGSLISRADSPYTDLESNYGCGDSISNDGWGPPPIERCMSCISKLGALSRSSTATVTMGVTPFWEHTCDRHSISSGSDSSGWSQTITRPPARPPKPGVSCPSPSKMSQSQTTYDNYDIPKIPYPVENKGDEHYDTPRKLKECLFETVQKPCGCIVRIRQPDTEKQPERQPERQPDRPCVCQRLMSCWTTTEDVQALYATVDKSKKCHRIQPTASTANYANLTPSSKPADCSAEKSQTTSSTTNGTNYENMEFAQTLQLYENSKEIQDKCKAKCTKCGHAQEDYLMMEPSNDKPAQPHPGYLPMSPAVKQRLEKVLSNSNPNLGPALDRSNKPSGSSMLQMNIYQRKHILDSTDNLQRKRSNSADSSSRCEEPEVTSPTPTCQCNQTIAVRRSSSVPCKSNRDSSSSNDSGVFELPRRIQLCPSTLPRRSKSSDPLRDLSFQFNKTDGKSASAEAEVPVCPSGSTSSGTSDMSDYFETLSLSSHSSSEAPPPSCTLRPRSGNEYLSLQRLIAPVPEERHN
ncbi:hypothetical protein HHI36_015471 [Cryptolaemus montrouzieri]|uniref:IRS-type PTB domain-containing protein n=1 Tax=Cryptolaemus montrouzieri TaxID=559131 RepID=A0ABD2N5U9_9CUCU